ncbi:MAG: hypothetical protein QOI31_2238 [Solirubrobacterales bacterium]|jgi:hypothetical protein|nr:hypothetical protein [Solirubrobacterales bacterium]
MSYAPAASAHRLTAIVLGVLVAVLALAPSAMARPKTNKYIVKVTYEALTSWTHNITYTNPSPQPGECTSRVDHGQGGDTVEVKDRVLMYAQKGSLGTLDVSEVILSSHARTGTMTHEASGAPECDQYDGSDPTTGCGEFGLETSFPQLELTGKSLTNVSLDWGDADPTPDFDDCPFFGGYDDAQNQFPDGPYVDMHLIELPPGLKKGKKVVRGEDSRSLGATQTCATIDGGCAPDTSHDATATLEAGVEVVFTRKGPKH